MNVLALGTAVSALAFPSALAAQVTERLTLAPGGVEAAEDCLVRAMSADARFVAFETYSPLFVAGDGNSNHDVFVLDRTSGAFELVSRSAAGGDADGLSNNARISADGRYVSFDSDATNLVPGGLAAGRQIYRRDRTTGALELVSRSSAGLPDSGGQVSSSAMTPGARYVLFESAATDVSGSPSPAYHVLFLRDITANTTEPAALGLAGAWPDAAQLEGALSSDARYVAFSSAASNLVAGDVATFSDVFRRDRTSGVTERVSLGLGGAEANADSTTLSISADGRLVAFASYATNLHAGDGDSQLDVFVRDMQTGALELASDDWRGQTSLAQCLYPVLSPDGRFVAFIAAFHTSGITPTHDSLNGLNVFVRDRALARTALASANSSWEDGDIGGDPVQFSSDARYLLLSSFSTNLVPGDTNGAIDGFLRDREQLFVRDLDADGYGDATVLSAPAIAPPAGFTEIPFDCDDNAATRHPGALELCNGVDDDCDNVADEGAELVCGSDVSSYGCLATLSTSGTPSAGASSGFTLSASGLNPQRSCALLYSLSPRPVPQAGTRCLGVPFVRFHLANSGGSASSTACDGSASADWLAFMASHPNVLGHPLAPGVAIYAQAIARDPSFPQFSDALRFAVCP